MGWGEQGLAGAAGLALGRWVGEPRRPCYRHGALPMCLASWMGVLVPLTCGKRKRPGSEVSQPGFGVSVSLLLLGPSSPRVCTQEPPGSAGRGTPLWAEDRAH